MADFWPRWALEPRLGTSNLAMITSTGIPRSVRSACTYMSAFPIAKGFSDGALDPKNLGDSKPIITRYNLYVPGMTDGKGPFLGRREAESF